jgi:hypothetical protein
METKQILAKMVNLPQLLGLMNYKALLNQIKN